MVLLHGQRIDCGTLAHMVNATILQMWLDKSALPKDGPVYHSGNATKALTLGLQIHLPPCQNEYQTTNQFSLSIPKDMKYIVLKIQHNVRYSINVQ